VTSFGALFSRNDKRTAEPDGRETDLMLTNWKARSDLRSRGTSLDRTLCTVGADEAGIQVSTIVFSLSLKVAAAAAVDRVHPSGTLMVK
jgi:hypothetical protein